MTARTSAGTGSSVVVDAGAAWAAVREFFGVVCDVMGTFVQYLSRAGSSSRETARKAMSHAGLANPEATCGQRLRRGLGELQALRIRWCRKLPTTGAC